MYKLILVRHDQHMNLEIVLQAGRMLTRPILAEKAHLAGGLCEADMILYQHTSA